MIFDSTGRCLTVATANFEVDLKALLIAKAIATGRAAAELADTTIFDREAAETFAERLGTETETRRAGLGIYGGQATTQAKQSSEGWRESDNLIVFDFYAINRSPTELGSLVELAAEAIMRTVDRIGETNLVGVVGAGEGIRSVLVKITGTAYVPKTQDWYQDRVTVTVPVVDQETGL